MEFLSAVAVGPAFTAMERSSLTDVGDSAGRSSSNSWMQFMKTRKSSSQDATIFVQDRDSPPLPLAGWDRQRNSRFLVPDSPCTDAEKEGGETDSDEESSPPSDLKCNEHIVPSRVAEPDCFDSDGSTSSMRQRSMSKSFVRWWALLNHDIDDSELEGSGCGSSSQLSDSDSWYTDEAGSSPLVDVPRLSSSTSAVDCSARIARRFKRSTGAVQRRRKRCRSEEERTDPSHKRIHLNQRDSTVFRASPLRRTVGHRVMQEMEREVQVELELTEERKDGFVRCDVTSDEGDSDRDAKDSASESTKFASSDAENNMAAANLLLEAANGNVVDTTSSAVKPQEVTTMQLQGRPVNTISWKSAFAQICADAGIGRNESNPDEDALYSDSGQSPAEVLQEHIIRCRPRTKIKVSMPLSQDAYEWFKLNYRTLSTERKLIEQSSAQCVGTLECGYAALPGSKLLQEEMENLHVDDSKQMEVVGISFPCKDEPLLKIKLQINRAQDRKQPAAATIRNHVQVNIDLPCGIRCSSISRNLWFHLNARGEAVRAFREALKMCPPSGRLTRQIDDGAAAKLSVIFISKRVVPHVFHNFEAAQEAITTREGQHTK